MAQLSTLHLNIVFFLSIALLSGVVFITLRNPSKKARKEQLSEEDFWHSLNVSFFDKHGREEDRQMLLEAMLDFGCRKLKLANGLLLERKGESYAVHTLVSDSYAMQGVFLKGKTIPGPDLYCGRTWAQNDVLAIEYAGITEWRNHRSYRLYGIETYIGVPVRENGELFGVLCFFDQHPRDLFFSRGERDFMNTLSSWTAVVLGKKLPGENSSDFAADARESSFVRGKIPNTDLST